MEQAAAAAASTSRGGVAGSFDPSRLQSAGSLGKTEDGFFVARSDVDSRQAMIIEKVCFNILML